MLKSTFALFLAVCLPLGSATTYQAALIDFCEDSGCSDADNGIVLSLPDGICFSLEAQGIYIQEFLGDCTFLKVWTSDSCTGSESADLGTPGKCWDVSTRNSFQIYC
ncbi:hypothetical protein OIDMADRAFT_182881 [Oidiodendron maius Zn]|uniref:Cyanovirin-N domain-containing protein n=1 Tax=Oidiodendron maius (strain Zn) TaxID=913774 RepID=A0A0C3GNM6_OIDMZ|nr:hypothetical protein OIDMADRAFT_182881 [Oidiodendron maius Zn]